MTEVKNIKKCVILAAGYGTRFLPFTKCAPKVILPIVDKPQIQYVVEEAIASGVEEIAIVIGVHKENIEKLFTHNKALEELLANKPNLLKFATEQNFPNIKFFEQKIMNGSCEALFMCEEFVNNEPFLLMFADDLFYNPTYPVSKQLIDLYKANGISNMVVKNVSRIEATKYGCIEFSETNGRCHKMTTITEKPKFEDVKSTLVNMGRYVLDASIFDCMRHLKETRLKGELNVVEAMQELSDRKGMIAYEFEGIRYDAGDKFGYIKAITDYALRDENLGEKYKDYILEKAKELTK